MQETAKLYPLKFAEYAQSDVERTSFNIESALSTQKNREISSLSIIDLGGNFALFSASCAKLGFKSVTVIDDFGDPVNLENGDGLLDLHRSLGVNIVSMDLVADLPDQLPEADIYVSFDSMEHWHSSPKALFNAIARQVSQGAGFVLGVPNCVNLRKRISVPLGRGKWSSMDDWYEKDNFRGHVREPDVGDLAYIADAMGLQGRRIVGRNFQGYYHANKFVRQLTKIVDKPLGLMPSVCSDIYLISQN